MVVKCPDRRPSGRGLSRLGAALSVGEMVLGAALLAPFVPTAVAGAALTGFSGALVTMYLRTDGLHRPRSIWPSQHGVGVSKDLWMLGIGLGLLAAGLISREDT